MKLVNAKIGIKGDLVNEGFGDLKVKIKGEEVLCVKSILIHGNKTFKKLIEDEQFSGVLELFDGCDIRSFLEIEKYYNGGIMELDEDNVCKILSFCIYYDDSFLLNQCKNYLKNHLNESIMVELLNSFHDISSNNNIDDIKAVSREYVKRNGYKLLENEELLLKLKMEDLDYILSCKNLIIKNENWLLDQLIKWKNEMKKLYEKDNDEEELKEEFTKLLKKYLHFEKINIKEISSETMNEIKKLNLYNEINRINYTSIDLEGISNDKIKDIIYKYYIEEEKTVIEIEEIELLNHNNITEIISILLSKDDIKLNEIGLLMILDSDIKYKNDKSRILKRLLNEEENDRIIKCLCLFVDDKKNRGIIEGLCGKEILFKILNFHYYLGDITTNSLINYIKEIGLTEKEENSLSETIVDKEIVDRFLLDRITSFSYPLLKCLCNINEEISITPSYNGSKCEFSISPSLPEGLVINKEDGIIHGRIENGFNTKRYEITCRNNISEKKFQMSLQFIDIIFKEINKNDGISISNDGKLITKTNIDGFSHAYLNIKMKKRIFRMKYKFIKKNTNESNNDNILIGLSVDNTYSGTNIYSQITTCNYCAWGGKSQDISPFCHIGTVVNKDPNFDNHGDGSIYEITVDMNKREFWINHNNSSPVLLVKDLPSPLYPYISIKSLNNSAELLSVSHQD